MKTRDLAAAALCIAAGPAFADPLAAMAGSWTGSGWAREVPGGAQEAVRCRLTNTHQPDRRRLVVSGRCAVPGRTFGIDGAIIVEPGGRVRGFWANPKGGGQTTIAGSATGSAVNFGFSARDPETGADVSQDVSWRTGAGLAFRAVSRRDRSGMAAIDFSR